MGFPEGVEKTSNYLLIVFSLFPSSHIIKHPHLAFQVQERALGNQGTYGHCNTQLVFHNSMKC